jgi:radical SAM protein with 4Fe4S-binding SPASM domain
MDCVHLPTLDGEELGRRLMRFRVPANGGIEITQRCNLGCVHCYCRKPAGDRAAKAAEPSLETIRRFIDEMAEAGTLFLYITGGEPLLRRDFLDIYDHVKSRGIMPVVFTNATLITPGLADHFAESPPVVVDISLYGMTEEVYERISGVPGSYKKCLEGIRLLLDRGIRVQLKTPALAQNRDQIGDLSRFAKELGVGFRFDVTLHPRLHDMADRYGPYEYGLTVQEKVELELADEERAGAWKAFAVDGLDVAWQDTIFKCGAGVNGFFVDVRGHMTMCVTSRYPSYDLNTGTFQEGWRFLVQFRQQVDEQESECRDCRLLALCQQCPARSQLEYGPEVLTKRVDWICELAHVRADRFGVLS